MQTNHVEVDGFRDSGVDILWRRDLPGDHTEATWWNGVGAFYVARNMEVEAR